MKRKRNRTINNAITAAGSKRPVAGRVQETERVRTKGQGTQIWNESSQYKLPERCALRRELISSSKTRSTHRVGKQVSFKTPKHKNEKTSVLEGGSVAGSLLIPGRPAGGQLLLQCLQLGATLLQRRFGAQDLQRKEGRKN